MGTDTNFSHLSGCGLLLHLAASKAGHVLVLDHVAKLGKGAVVGLKCGGLGGTVTGCDSCGMAPGPGLMAAEEAGVAPRARRARVVQGAPISDNLAHSC